MTAVSARELCDRSVAFLEDVWSPERALHPYSTDVVDGGYVHDFRRAGAVRYTINSLLGLQAAAAATGSPSPERVEALTEAFLESHAAGISSVCDLGLLLVLLADRPDDPRTRMAAETVARAASHERLRGADMQTVAWMLWGATALARTGSAAAETAADALARLVVEGFADRRSGLPRHSSSLHRRGFVSFGAVVYYLRALHEYGSLTADPAARELFEGGVARMQAIQGPQGEWPWLIAVRTGRPVDVYPVFAVHQDAMAMLFLHPALDLGLPGAQSAIERSFAWALGENELGLPMYADVPFRAYRSIRRAGPLPVPRRYVRAAANTVLGRESRGLDGRGVVVNPECRSYHLGWLLYVWSARPGLFGRVTGARSEADRERAPQLA